ncbi:hypothetical protein TNCV_575161 [Trichonephila clavipes]|nr:hypothetical protein TNCV_575161 [Trichonephila clavipes]
MSSSPSASKGLMCRGADVGSTSQKINRKSLRIVLSPTLMMLSRPDVGVQLLSNLALTCGVGECPPDGLLAFSCSSKRVSSALLRDSQRDSHQNPNMLNWEDM